MLDQIQIWLLLGLALVAWIRFAEHPNARTLRTALATTFGA
jgi:hypothetical protein